MALYSRLSGQMALKDTQVLEEKSGDSDSVFMWQLDPSPRYFFQGEISKQMSLKWLFVRNKPKIGGREEGGREGERSSSSHHLKMLWVEILLQVSCIPFHCADVNSCERSPGCSSGFAVIADSRSYSGMPPAGIFPINSLRDEMLYGHTPSLEAKRQS